MTDFYPQLGHRFDSKLKSDLHAIGFTNWVHLKKEKQDGKIRLTWTYPIEGHKDWFLVQLVLENDKLCIDFINNPLGQSFGREDVRGLITFINSIIKK